MRKPEAPLFQDPIFNGAADPTIIWNHIEKQWWIIYTQRPASLPGPGNTNIHGSDLGVASSEDGHNWLYRGTLQGLEFEFGRNTFWAPEILFHEGVYHMYVSYVRGMPIDWNRPRMIIHYTSSNLWQWHFESVMDFNEEKIIDACVAKLPSGQWRMWYKDEQDGAFSHCADSDDLYHWKHIGRSITHCNHEGPNVFFFHGAWWLIGDFWKGQGVFRSEDGLDWTYQGMILDQPGNRPMDNAIANHADVLVAGDEAYIFYFTHPHRGSEDIALRRSTALQVARLQCDGNTLTCDRDEEFDFSLPSGEQLGHFS